LFGSKFVKPVIEKTCNSYGYICNLIVRGGFFHKNEGLARANPDRFKWYLQVWKKYL